MRAAFQCQNDFLCTARCFHGRDRALQVEICLLISVSKSFVYLSVGLVKAYIFCWEKLSNIQVSQVGKLATSADGLLSPLPSLYGKCIREVVLRTLLLTPLLDSAGKKKQLHKV
jgi:hypothetical protein